jgi:hypothetical protein
MNEFDANYAKLNLQSPQMIARWIGVHAGLLILQILGGWFGYTFPTNIFLGVTLILAVVMTAIALTVSNTVYAKQRTWAWYTFLPFLVGFVSLGFGWFFTWLVWWGIFLTQITKKTMGDKELEESKIRDTSGAGSIPVPPSSFQEDR